MDYIKDASPGSIIKDFITIGNSIGILHKNKISHRDIKPENIIYVDGKPHLSDFGLVKYPEASSLTKAKRDVGAKFTMAPEMRRMASCADGIAADVYSFAKTLWIALSRERLGFDGQFTKEFGGLLRKKWSDFYFDTFDEIMVSCTKNIPEERPKINDVVNLLKGVLQLQDDFHSRNLNQWDGVKSSIFPLVVPKTAEWDNFGDILKVLTLVTKFNSMNHMFYPDGGGNNICQVTVVKEEGCLGLQPQSGGRLAIVKPKKLIFESFGDSGIWDYFMLITEELSPFSDEFTPSDINMSEELVMLKNGKYVKGDIWWADGNHYSDARYDLDGASICSRYVEGKFLFCSTRGPYNSISATYDARHNNFTQSEMRIHIEALEKGLSKMLAGKPWRGIE